MRLVHAGLGKELYRVVLEEEDDVDDLAEAAQPDGTIDHGSRRRRVAHHRDHRVQVLREETVHVVVRADDVEGEEEAPGDDALAL